MQGPEVRYQALKKAALAMVFSARKASSLLPKFHSGGDDGLTYPKGSTETGRGRKDGALGTGVLRV